MSKVNPPPVLRIPQEILNNQNTRSYFEQINKILFQLWMRTGGGSDAISEITITSGDSDSKATQALSLVSEVIQYIQNAESTSAINEANIIAALQAIQGIESALSILALAPPAVAVPQNNDILPPAVPQKRIRHGMFYDTTIQTATLANTAYGITYNTTSLSEGVYLGSPTSRVYVDTEGVYNFQFSIQLDKTSGGTASFWIWARLNGADVSDSASQVRIQGNDAEIFTAANYFLDLKAGDYVEFIWAVSDTSVQLQYFAAAAPVPAIPSIILTVSNNISQ